MTGATAEFEEVVEFGIAAGSYEMTGAPAGLLMTHILSCETGSFSMNGSDANLIVFNPNAPPPTPPEQEQMGRGGGSAPKAVYADTLELFRGKSFDRGVRSMVPPRSIADRNLTTPAQTWARKPPPKT
jgi:hypothetical protein